MWVQWEQLHWKWERKLNRCEQTSDYLLNTQPLRKLNRTITSKPWFLVCENTEKLAEDKSVFIFPSERFLQKVQGKFQCRFRYVIAASLFRVYVNYSVLVKFSHKQTNGQYLLHSSSRSTLCVNMTPYFNTYVTTFWALHRKYILIDLIIQKGQKSRHGI